VQAAPQMQFAWVEKTVEDFFLQQLKNIL